MTTTTFADYAASAQARKDIELGVMGYTLQLCEALRQNFIDYSIRNHERSLGYYRDEGGVKHHQEAIAKLKQGICDYDFYPETGRKYHKVIMNANGQCSVHCFIDKKTGQIYKSASWKSPAKGVRYDLRLIQDREWLFQHADWASSYLYAR